MPQIQNQELTQTLTNKKFIIGADEVGYGSVAGELVICGVKASKDWHLKGLNDSKKMTPNSRETMRGKLQQLAEQGEIRFAIASRTNLEIDSMGVAAALRSCYEEVFLKLTCPDSLLIVDGNLKFDNLTAQGYDIKSIVKADGKIPAVMAASILGKTYRDERMRMIYHPLHPVYRWDINFGYPTPLHIEAIEQHGLSPLHRRSYKIKKLLWMYESIR